MTEKRSTAERIVDVIREHEDLGCACTTHRSCLNVMLREVEAIVAERCAAAEARADQAERLKAQAIGISFLLAEANVGACPIEEGVRILIQRADQAELERDELAGWKASAMQSLTEWHALGEVLMDLGPLQLGDNIPKALMAKVRERFRRM